MLELLSTTQKTSLSKLQGRQASTCCVQGSSVWGSLNHSLTPSLAIGSTCQPTLPSCMRSYTTRSVKQAKQGIPGGYQSREWLGFTPSLMHCASYIMADHAPDSSLGSPKHLGRDPAPLTVLPTCACAHMFANIDHCSWAWLTG
jgi:hypothetical protein